jgi:hypothetical protein
VPGAADAPPEADVTAGSLDDGEGRQRAGDPAGADPGAVDFQGLG